ncbi:MAG: hypothetical protein JKX96_02870 [Acinetobacter sp.]|nr:hypothetical protein [Acinetobacter sp.]
MARTARDYFDYRIQQMRSERSSWTAHWKDLNKNFQPRRGKFDSSDTNKGNKRNQLPNNTPLFAKRVLRAGMMTGATSPARPWFKLGPPDPDMADFGPVRGWLDDVQDVMYRVFASSGLYRALPSIYEECGTIGTACMLQEEDFENVTRFTVFTVGEYMLDINGKNVVDTFAREYQQTVHQIVTKFGLENCSTNIQQLYANGNLSAYFHIRHIIEPNTVPIDGLDKLDGFAFRSVYYEEGNRGGVHKYLSVKGYHEFPVHAPRWDTKPGDTYGNSPGMDALGDAFALQVQEKEKGKAVAKMVSPPTTAPSALRNTQLSLLPGANNFTDDPNNVFRAIYQINPRVEELSEDIRRTEDRINRAFYVDMFLMLQSDNRNQRATATEVAEKHEEKLLQLGPVLENLNDELLDPIINRTFNMLVRASEPGWRGFTDKMMIPPPPELENVELRVEYTSILAQAQKMVATSAIERWVGFVGNMAAIGKEDVLDKVNSDEIADIMAKDLGVPNAAVYTDDEVSGLREDRANQIQQQQMAERGAMMADSAKTMSETETTGDSVLADIVSGGGIGG